MQQFILSKHGHLACSHLFLILNLLYVHCQADSGVSSPLSHHHPQALPRPVMALHSPYSPFTALQQSVVVVERRLTFTRLSPPPFHLQTAFGRWTQLFRPSTIQRRRAPRPVLYEQKVPWHAGEEVMVDPPPPIAGLHTSVASSCPRNETS